MLKKATQHLIVLNASVFVLVLGVFSGAVYFSVTHNTDREKERRLEVVTDALVSSIESPDEDQPHESIPDVVQSHDRKDQENTELSLEWFTVNQQLAAKKGLLSTNVPFDKSAGFQTQTVQHALLLTRPVERDGRLIGYLRVGMSLSDSDSYKRNLLIGLATGTVLALLVSGIAILWLVRQALKPVGITMQKLSDFTGDASHELKSPLTVIKTNGAVALKYSEGMSDRHRRNIERMLDAADQMTRTISDLLSLAESEHELSEQVVMPVSVDDLIRGVVEELNASAAAKEVRLTCELNDPTLTLEARQPDLKLVLGNVVRNSIAYSKPGASVLVGAARIGNRIQIEVRDSGIGISEEDLPKIFDRFWRSDRARSYTSGGNGLGLSIVKSIVDRYRGEIVVRSKLGEGTTFTILLPSQR